MSSEMIFLAATALAAGLSLGAGAAQAEGELFLYNWSNYIPPELLQKFEQETGIKVTLDVYDSNETMLAKLQAGAAGYDIVVPSDYMVRVMIDEGLALPIDASQMANFKNVTAPSRQPAVRPRAQVFGALPLGHDRLLLRFRAGAGRRARGELAGAVRAGGGARRPDRDAQRRGLGLQRRRLLHRRRQVHREPRRRAEDPGRARGAEAASRDVPVRRHHRSHGRRRGDRAHAVERRGASHQDAEAPRWSTSIPRRASTSGTTTW